jgi:chondroitin AC lyase
MKRKDKSHLLNKNSLLVILFFTLSTSKMYCNDIDTLKERLYSHYLSEYGWYQDAEKHLPTQLSDGSWPDINYDDVSRVSWKPVNHLKRIYLMSLAFNTESDDFYKNSEMLSAIIKGLEFWYEKKPQSDNWIYNDVIPQISLMPTLITMEKHIPRSLIDTGITFFNEPDKTGANLVWLSAQSIHKGVLNNSVTDIELGIDSIASSINITSGDGIQNDYSFHQHLDQLYNNGYGQSFTNDVAFWIYMTRGLSFKFDEAKIEILSNYLLQGTQWMTYKSDLDFSTVGRTISRKSVLDNAGVLLKPLEQLYKLGRSDTSEIRKYIEHIKGGDNPLIGNKHFWISDYHSHRRKNYAVSVKMSSKRVNGTEMTNKENSEGYFLPYGAMYIANKEDSFFDIAPVWDWCRIPGVTCAHRDAPPRIPWPFFSNTSFVGGVSNGTYGVAAMDLDVDSVTGKKAWFFFDNEIVALGANISSHDETNIITSINQTHLTNAVFSFTDNEKEHTAGEHQLSSTKWVFHDSIAYIFPAKHTVMLKNEKQTGSWADVNIKYTNEEVSEDIFSLWLDHGTKPSNSSYQYIVMPNANKSELNTYYSNLPVSVIENSNKIQAVIHNELKVSGIVFHEKGSLQLSDNIQIGVNSPCIMLLDENRANLSVSDPTNSLISLEVEVKYGSQEVEKIIFNLPKDQDAGKTMTKSLVSFPTGNTPTFFLGENKLTGIKVYPIPAKESITVFAGVEGILNIYNLKGIKLESRKIHAAEEHIDLNLAAGTYIVKVDTDEGSFSLKILIQ